jgi:hypothetical protein
LEEETNDRDYFARLDISMDETHVCVVDREGVVIHEGKSASTSQSIPDELAKAPSCRRIVFETGRMAPILFHGLNQLDLPVCREPAGLSGAQVECGTLGASAGLRGLPPTKPSKSSLRPTQTNCRKIGGGSR